MNGRQTRKITVVLRYDDYGANSDANLERRIIDLLRKHGLCAVFGVVPFACPNDSARGGPAPLSLHGDKATLLRQAVADGFVEAALHGYCHEFRALPAGGNSEFAGRDQAEQLDLILRGATEVEICSGESPLCFIPPFNSYDQSTVNAIEQAGMECLSASMFGPVWLDVRMRFFPQTCALAQVRRAVNAARKGPDRRPLIMPLFHEFDFAENDPVRGQFRLVQFEELLLWLVSQPDVVVQTVTEVLENGHDLSPERYLAHQNFLRTSLHPWSVPNDDASSARLMLQEASVARRQRRSLMLRSFLAYGLVALCGLASGFSLASLDIMSKAVTGCVVLAVNVVWLLVLLWRKSGIYYNAARLSLFLLMSLAGVLSL